MLFPDRRSGRRLTINYTERRNSCEPDHRNLPNYKNDATPPPVYLQNNHLQNNHLQNNHLQKDFESEWTSKEGILMGFPDDYNTTLKRNDKKHIFYVDLNKALSSTNYGGENLSTTTLSKETALVPDFYQTLEQEKKDYEIELRNKDLKMRRDYENRTIREILEPSDDELDELAKAKAYAVNEQNANLFNGNATPLENLEKKKTHSEDTESGRESLDTAEKREARAREITFLSQYVEDPEALYEKMRHQLQPHLITNLTIGGLTIGGSSSSTSKGPGPQSPQKSNFKNSEMNFGSPGRHLRGSPGRHPERDARSRNCRNRVVDYVYGGIDRKNHIREDRNRGGNRNRPVLLGFNRPGLERLGLERLQIATQSARMVEISRRREEILGTARCNKILNQAEKKTSDLSNENRRVFSELKQEVRRLEEAERRRIMEEQKRIREMEEQKRIREMENRLRQEEESRHQKEEEIRRRQRAQEEEGQREAEEERKRSEAQSQESQQTGGTGGGLFDKSTASSTLFGATIGVLTPPPTPPIILTSEDANATTKEIDVTRKEIGKQIDVTTKEIKEPLKIEVVVKNGKELGKKVEIMEELLEREFLDSKEKDIKTKRLYYKKQINTFFSQISHQNEKIKAAALNLVKVLQEAWSDFMKAKESAKESDLLCLAQRYTVFKINDMFFEAWENIPLTKGYVTWQYCYTMAVTYQELEKQIKEAKKKNGTNSSSAQSSKIIHSKFLLPPDIFLDVFLGIAYTRCIYAIPYWEELCWEVSGEEISNDSSIIEKRRKARKQYKDESEDEFHKRMTNQLRIYLGCLIFLKKHSIIWTWFASVLNSNNNNTSSLNNNTSNINSSCVRIRRITPMLVDVGLEFAGYALARRYKNQFFKILSYIEKIFLPVCEEMRSTLDPKNAAFIITKTGNIKTWIETFKKEGIEGIKPEGFELTTEEEIELREDM